MFAQAEGRREHLDILELRGRKIFGDHVRVSDMKLAWVGQTISQRVFLVR
jgi:hypothetical protein